MARKTKEEGSGERPEVQGRKRPGREGGPREEKRGAPADSPDAPGTPVPERAENAEKAEGAAGPDRAEGAERAPGQRRFLEVTRPRDGSLIERVPVRSLREVMEAVETARSAQHHWIEREAEERFAALKKLIPKIGEKTDEIAEIISEETGKPGVEAIAEVLLTVDLLKYYVEVAPRILRRQWVKTNWLIGKSAYTYSEPYGVIGAITPWNYPFLLVMDAVSPALFTGNSVVLKPSEHTPLSALKAVELAREAGLPEGLFQVVTGDGETGKALVNAGVDKIMFTGSSRTGRKVMAAAAESLTPVALELGGKDPAIVLEDADVDRAARGIVYGGFFNAGQTCISTERVFVVDEIYDEFVAEVVELTRRLRVEPDEDGQFDIGPMVTPEQLEVVEDQIEDAVSRGARIVEGGERLAPDSRVFRPTVLTDVNQSMKVLWEETFGPVLPIMRVQDAEDAVRLVNVSPFGLFASVWTENRVRGERLGERLRCGGVSINDTLSHYAVPGLPIGGVGESGFGRRRGVAGLEEMTRSRTVLIHRTGLSKEIWWFPYTEKAYRLVRALLDYRQATGMKRIWSGIRRLFTRTRRRP